jgi:hypothetical protein
LTPEEESDALLDALAAGEPPDCRDPAARVLAVLRGDVVDQRCSGDRVHQGRSGDVVGQRRSSVSMTPST